MIKPWIKIETEESFDQDYEIQSRKGSEVGEISARILAASLENEKNKRGKERSDKVQDFEEEEEVKSDKDSEKEAMINEKKGKTF